MNNRNPSPAELKWEEKMRQDWDSRARENAPFYICTDVPADEESFLASGREDYNRFVKAFFERMGFDPAGKIALEIGCGIGRMTRCFAQEFQEVIGIDISPEMIARAKSYSIPRATFEVGSGYDLLGVADASVDFVFSYIVFQHIPAREVILHYASEIGRVLRPGGLFRVHLNGRPCVRIGGTLIEGYVSQSPKLRLLGLKKLPLVRRRALGTWMGHPVSVTEFRRAGRRWNLQILETTGRWSHNMWIGGCKPANWVTKGK